MIAEETRIALLGLHRKGMKIRQISRALGISRNTVKRVVYGNDPGERSTTTSFENELPLIRDMFARCRGNVVRVQEMLADQGISIGYSTLTRIARERGLREPEKKRAGVSRISYRAAGRN